MNDHTSSTPTLPPPAPDQATPAAPRDAAPRRRSVATVTLGVVLLAVGVLSLLLALDVDVPVRIVGPVVLITVGLGLVVSAVRGERHGAIVGLATAVGVVLAVTSLAAAAIDVPLRGGVGERVHAPASVSQLEDEYRLFAGTLTLDLRGLEVPSGTTRIELSTVLGEVNVLLPDEVGVSVDSSIVGGSAQVLGTTIEGLAVDNDRRTDGYDTAERRIELHVSVGFGEVGVTR